MLNGFWENCMQYYNRTELLDVTKNPFECISIDQMVDKYLQYIEIQYLYKKMFIIDIILHVFFLSVLFIFKFVILQFIFIGINGRDKQTASYIGLIFYSISLITIIFRLACALYGSGKNTTVSNNNNFILKSIVYLFTINNYY